MDNPSSTPRRILAVDDNVGSAQLMGLLLQKLGPYHVELAHDGATAIELARRFCPDVMLLDLKLPDMSGVQVVQTLRGQAEVANTLFVAITGCGSPEDCAQTAAAGFDLHLLKPVGVDQLKEVLAMPCGVK